MIAEKRARLDLTIERSDIDVSVSADQLLHLISTLHIKNEGTSKAFVGLARGILVTKSPHELLDVDGLEDEGYATLDLPSRVLDADMSTETKAYLFPHEITAPTFAECLEKGVWSLHFFGYIEYESIGLWWRKEFGYEWKVLDRRGGYVMLGLSDPYPNSPRPPKDRIAYGHWVASEKDKPEYSIPNPNNEEKPN